MNVQVYEMIPRPNPFPPSYTACIHLLHFHIVEYLFRLPYQLLDSLFPLSFKYLNIYYMRVFSP